MRLKLYRGWWCAVWTEGGATRRVSLRTKDRDAAASALADLQRAPSSDGTVASIYAAYLADKGTERARIAWIRLSEAFGPLRPDQVTRATCRAYTAARRRDVGDGTIHIELTYLRAALRWHDQRTPAVVELPSKPAPRDDYLTREQYVRLLDAATEPHIRLFIALAIATGGRATALLQLEWDRVDFERGLIRLGDGTRRRKGRATLPMTDTIRAALMQAAEARTCNHVIEFAGKPILRIVKGFRSVAKAAGMPWCTPHVLRHTAAVWMADAGVPMEEIAQYLGHSDSRITERVYARYSPGYLARAARALT
jgi:integrase